MSENFQTLPEVDACKGIVRQVLADNAIHSWQAIEAGVLLGTFTLRPDYFL